MTDGKYNSKRMRELRPTAKAQGIKFLISNDIYLSRKAIANNLNDNGKRSTTCPFAKVINDRILNTGLKSRAHLCLDGYNIYIFAPTTSQRIATVVLPQEIVDTIRLLDAAANTRSKATIAPRRFHIPGFAETINEMLFMQLEAKNV